MSENNNDIEVPTGSHGFGGEWPKGQLTSGSLIQDLAEGAVRSDRSLAAQIQKAVQKVADFYPSMHPEDTLERRYAQGAVDALSFLRGKLSEEHPFAQWMFSLGIGRPKIDSDAEED